MPLSLPPGTLTPRPRRLVDRRGDKTTTTRKSAQAKIPGLVQGLSTLSELTSPAGPVNNSTSAAIQAHHRHPATALLQQRRTLDFAESISSHDSSDSDSSYSSFVSGLRKKDALRLDSQLRIDELLDRTVTEQSIVPSPTLTTTYHTRATTYRVLNSHYEGNQLQHSKLKAQLAVAPARRAGETDFSRPLFKWMHIENPVMNFGAYMEYVTKCPYLNDSERASVSRILRTAREKSERSLRKPFSSSGSYIEPEYFEEALEYIDYQRPRSKHTKKEVLRWITIPYFYLSSDSVLPDKMERNHRSYVPFGTGGSVANGGFFQVAQLWCLIFGDHVVISCFRSPLTKLPRALIDFSYVAPTESSARNLQVTDGGLRLWLIPVKECETWLSFISHFVGLGFATFEGWQVKYRNVVLGPTDWGSVINAAKKTTIRLEIFRRDEASDQDNFLLSPNDESNHYSPGLRPTSRLNHRRSSTAQTDLSRTPSPATDVSERDGLLLPYDGPSAESDLLVNNVHVFTLLATVPAAPSSSAAAQSTGSAYANSSQYKFDEQQLAHDMTELDHYLSTVNARHTESLRYAECPSKTFFEVQRSCSALVGDHNKDKKLLVKAVRSTFELFFPLDYEHTVTLKFWGSIDRIIHTNDAKTEPVIADIVHIAKLAKEIRNELSSDKEASACMATIPQEFVQAWIRLQLYFAGFLIDHPHRSATRIHRCKDRLWQGRLKLAERLQTTTIRDREAVLPLGAIVLLVGQLLHDSQGPVTPEGHRLTLKYWAFFKELKNEVYERPLDRKCEETFTTLKYEFETIISTLEDQQRVLMALEDSISEAEGRSFAFSSSISKKIVMEQSREASVTEHLLHQTEEMLQNFGEIARHLNDLENYHFLCLSIDNDMQQKASFAFTTVTVFFLPLTTLAGILGMNTSDIRNLSETQWLFWCIAIPLAVICLSTWLIYLGALQKAWTWQRKRKTLKRKKVA